MAVSRRMNENHKSIISEKYQEIDIQRSFFPLFPSKPRTSLIPISIMFICNSLYLEFQNIYYFWFILIIILSFYDKSIDFSFKVANLICFLFLIFISIFQRLRKFSKKLKNESVKNSELVQVWRPSGFMEVQVSQLKPGDLVTRNNGEEIPADILLIWCGTEKSAFFDMKKFFGVREPVEKRPAKSLCMLEELENDEILIFLSKIESLETSLPSADLKDFKAKIQLKGDPKVYLSGLGELALQGSKLKSSEAVAGIVIFSGGETSLSLTHKSAERRVLLPSSTFFSVLQLIHFLITVLIVVVGFSYKSSSLSESPDFQIEDFFIWNILMYSNLVSLSLLISLKLAGILASLQLRLTNKGLRVEPDVIGELGQVEYLLVDKEELVQSNEMKITTINIENESYVKGSSNERFRKPSSPTSYSTEDGMFNFGHLINIFQSDKVPQTYLEFLFAVALDQEVFYKESEKNNQSHKIRKILQKLGFSSNSSKKKFNFQFKSRSFDFKKLDSYQSKNFNFILASARQTHDVWVLARSNSESFFNDRDSNIQSKSTSLESQSLKTFYFLSRFQKKDLPKISAELKLARKSLVNPEKRVKNVFKSLLTEVVLLGFFSFEYPKNKEMARALKNIRNSGIKTWIVSNDNLLNTVLACKSCKTLDFNPRVIHFTEVGNKSLARSCMLRVLKEENLLIHSRTPENEIFDYSQNFENLSFTQVKKQEQSIRKLKRNKTIKSFMEYSKTPEKTLNFRSFQLKNGLSSSFSLIIDSDFLNQVLLYEDSRKLLVILLFLAKSVIFVGLSSQQKQEIVKLAKEDFSFSPLVSAFGDFCSDPGFLSEAHVSLTTSRSLNSESSVVLSEGSEIDQLFISHGQRFSVVFFKILALSTLKEFTLCSLFLAFQAFNRFNPCSLIEFDAFVLFEFLISIFLMTALVFNQEAPQGLAGSGRKYEWFKDDHANNQLRSTSFIQKIKILTRFAAFGIIQGAVFMIFIVLCPGFLKNKLGMTEELQSTQILAFLVVFIAFFLQVLVFCEKVSVSFAVFNFLSVACLGIFVGFRLFEGMGYGLIMNPIFWIQVVLNPVITTLFFQYFFQNLKNPLFSTKPRIFSFASNLEKIVKKSQKLSKKSLSSKSLVLGLKSLKFDSEYQELKYQEFQSSFMRNQLKFVISLVSLISLVFLVLQFSGSIDSIKYKIYSIFPSLLSLIFVIGIFKNKINLSRLVFGFGLFILSILITFSVINESKTILNFISVEVLLSISFHFKFKITTILIILFYLGSSFVVIFLSTKDDSEFLLNFQFLFVTFFIACLLLLVSYLIDLSKRQEYIFIQQSERLFKKSNQILSYLLPQFVKKRVNDGVRYIAEEKGVVSVIFCDICEFDQIIEDYSQTELVALLDDLFSRFDKICQEVGVSKIETVGKTYMACAGLKDFDSDLSSSINEISHARRAIEMAFAVLQESQKTLLKTGNHLKLKIGIHSGPVVAGVVGYHKPQFSLVGDTVNTASRMASTLETFNKIQISVETFKLLENNSEGLVFVNNFPEVKGKGKMKTLLVESDSKMIENYAHSKGLNLIQTSQTSSFDKLYGKDNKIIPKEVKEEGSWFTYFRNDSLGLKEKLIQIFFIESKTDKEFQHFFNTHTKSLQFVGLLVSFFHNLFSIAVSSIQYSSSESTSSLSTLMLYLTEEFLTIVLIFYLKFKKSSKGLFFALQGLLLSEILIFFIQDYQKTIDFQLSLTLFFLRFLQMNFCTSFLFFRNILTNLISISILILKLSLFSKSFEIFLYSFFFISCTLTSTYTREAKLRKDFKIREKFQSEHEKTDRLLTQMLPSQVLSNLQRELNVVEDISKVTVIYADIVGFTQWSASRSPVEVISMLSELFTRFDKLCVEFSIYKVYTIGDCYVGMGYEGKERRNPAKEAVLVLKFALELVKVIQEVNEKTQAGLNMRIGLHTGDVIGAITGTNIVRYDIYGKDVLIANKMESQGLAGMINISESTKDLIESVAKNDFKFTQFKQVKAWNSLISSYLVSLNY